MLVVFHRCLILPLLSTILNQVNSICSFKLTAIVTLEQIRVYPNYLKQVFQYPIFYHPSQYLHYLIDELQIGKLDLQKQTGAWKIRIVVQNVQVKLKLHERDLPRDEDNHVLKQPKQLMIEKIHEQKRMLLDSIAQTIQTYLTKVNERKTSKDSSDSVTSETSTLLNEERDKSKDAKLGWKDRVLNEIVERIDVSIENVYVEICGEEPYSPETPLGLTVDHINVTSQPHEENTQEDPQDESAHEGEEEEKLNPQCVAAVRKAKTDRCIKIGKIELYGIDSHEVEKLDDSEEQSIQKEKISLVSITDFQVKMVMPSVMQVLLNPLPLEEKSADVLVSVPHFNVSVNTERLLLLTRYYVPVKKHQMLYDMLSKEEAAKCSENVSEATSNEYIEMYRKFHLATRDKLSKSEKERLEKIEDDTDMDTLLKLRVNSMDWKDTLFGENATDASEIYDALNKIQQEQTPLRNINVDVKLGEFLVNFIENSMQAKSESQNVGAIAFSNLYVGAKKIMDTSDEDASILGAHVKLASMDFTVEEPSRGFKHSQIISNGGEKSALLEVSFDQKASGKQKVQLHCCDLSLICCALPLEKFLLYLNDATAEPQERLAACNEEGSATGNEGSQSQQKLGDVPSSRYFALLGGQLLDVELQLTNLKAYVTPNSIDSRGYMMQFRTSVCVEVHSNEIDELISVDISDVSLSPSTYNYEDGEDHIDMFNEGSNNYALLNPTTMSCEYSLKDDEAKESSLCYQRLKLKVPDINLYFSDENMWILLRSFEDLSNIRTMTPEQKEKRLKAQRSAEESERSMKMQNKLQETRHIFELIDEDNSGSIEVSELESLLQETSAGEKLLKSEVSVLANAIFGKIDEDHSETIEFEELERYLTDTFGSAQLDGHLNMRAGEYSTVTVIEEKFGKLEGKDFKSFFSQPEVLDNFWRLYESETKATRENRNKQPPLLLQKKLIRLLENFDAAKACWDNIINPELMEEQQCQWLVKKSYLCGGLSEYENSTKLILSEFNTSDYTIDTSEKSKEEEKVASIKIETDIDIGDLRLVLVDKNLQNSDHRADLVLHDFHCAAQMLSDSGPYKYDVSHATSEWDAIFGFEMSAQCYSDLGHAMEKIIEPWDLMIGVSSTKNKEGLSALVQADRRLQMNVTSSLLHVVNSLSKITSGKAPLSPTARSDNEILDQDDGVFVRNYTGVQVGVFGADEDKSIDIDGVQMFKSSSSYTVSIDGWGKSEKVSLPRVGKIDVVVLNEKDNSSKIILTAVCRSKGGKQIVTLSSNVYITNNTDSTVEIKTLVLGCEKHDKTPVILKAQEKLQLPATVELGITEIYLRPKGSEEWTVNTSMNNDLVTKFDEASSSSSAKKPHRKGKVTTYEASRVDSNVVKMLTPNIVLSKTKVNNNLQWDITVLPAFVIRNALPYSIEFTYYEYDLKSKRSSNSFDEIENKLREESSSVLTVESGRDVEFLGLSSLNPVYISFRMVQSVSAKKICTDWSKPLLMAIHRTVESYTSKPEKIELSNSHITVERLTAESTPRLVRFSSPYWVMNQTALDLEYSGGEDAEKKLEYDTRFNSPALLDIPDDHLSFQPTNHSSTKPIAWNSLPDLTTPPSVEFSDKSWCSPLNTTTVNTTGEAVCGSNALGVGISALFGAYQGTNVVKISPRYIVLNKTDRDISFVPLASSDPQSVTSDLISKAPVCNVSSQESAVVYSFASDSKGKLLELQKYMKFSSLIEGEDEEWSKLVPVSTASDQYFQLYKEDERHNIIMQASIQVVDMEIFIILTDASEHPPYRLENYTSYSLWFKQGDEGYMDSVGSGKWCSFAWDDANSKDRKVSILIDDPKSSKKKTIDVDGVGLKETFNATVKNNRKVEIVAHIVPNENTRVLRLMDKEMSQKHVQDPEESREILAKQYLSSSSFDIRLNGIGLSLIDAYPQEVLFLCIDDVLLQKECESMLWSFSVFHVQIDNMLTGAKFPVILNPIGTGHSSNSKDGLKPFFSAVIDSVAGEKLGIYRLLEVSLSSMTVKIDLDFLFNLTDLFNPYLSSGSTTEAVMNKDNVLYGTLTIPEEAHAEDVLYFEKLLIHAITMELEYSLTRKDIAKSAGDTNILLGALIQVVGMIGSNLSGSPDFSFSEIGISQCFTTKDNLTSLLTQNYSRQAVMQAYRLIASVDIIGDPIGLVEDLGSGVVEFFKLTSGEVFGDSQTRGEGVKVLGKTILQSSTSSVAKITGGLDKFVGDLSVEDDSKDDRKEEDKDISLTSFGGGMNFAKNIGKNITGIVTKPVEGAMKGGVTGLVQGAVRGITDPGVTLLKGITSTSHSLASGLQNTMADRSPFGGRRRMERKFVHNILIESSDKVLSHPTLMTVSLIGASGLVTKGNCNSYCELFLEDQCVVQTKVLHNTANPEWQERRSVELGETASNLKFRVRDSFGAINTTIGVTTMTVDQLQKDFIPKDFVSSLQKWVKTGQKPENVTRIESYLITEKEYTLWSNKKNGDAMKDGLEVEITLMEIKDIKVSKNLLNAMSSDISPYVSMSVGNKSSQKSTSKSGSNATWNERFNFRINVDELAENPFAKFEVHDKSMIYDGSLGKGKLELDMGDSGFIGTREEWIDLYESGDSDKKTGGLKVKVAITSPSSSNLERGDSTLDATIKAGHLRVYAEFQ